MELANDLRSLISHRLADASDEEILRITSALCGSRQAPAAARAPFNFAMPAAERFTLIGSDGRPLRSGEGPHVATYDALLDLTWTAGPVADGAELEWREAMKAAQAVRLFGCSDWRAPTVHEQVSIIDYSREDPALDTSCFRGPYGWVWTATEAVSPAGYAWYVNLDNGNAGRSRQSIHNRVRAVRAGQPFALGFSRPG